jgi:hypothetical protein
VTERQQLVELLAVALGAVLTVIAVLLAAPGVAARRLDVRARVGRDPDVGPGRRYGQPLDAGERLGVGDQAAAVAVVGVRDAGAAPAPDAGLIVAAVHDLGLGARHGCCVPTPRAAKPCVRTTASGN